MSRHPIIPKVVAGQSAVQIDIRLIMLPLYPATTAEVKTFWGYYKAGDLRIEDASAEGNVTLGNLIGSSSKTAIYNALVAQVGAVTKAVLLMNQVNDDQYIIGYTKAGAELATTTITGSFITTAEYNAIKEATLAQITTVLIGGYSKTLAVSSSAALTDYPITFTAHNTTGTDTATDVYLGNTVRSDWGDLRITDNADTPLPYAIVATGTGSITITFTGSLSSGTTNFKLKWGTPSLKAPFKIAHLTDTHYDPNDTYVNRHLTLQNIDNYVGRMQTYLPDLAVNAGDKIGESNNTIGNESIRLGWYQDNVTHFAAVGPYAGKKVDGVAPGNHDVEAMNWVNVLAKHSTETWMVSGKQYGYWESADFRFISVDVNYVPSGETHVNAANQGYGYMNATQLTWLTDRLAESTKPVVMFCHQGLGEMTTDVLTLTKEIYHTQNRAAIRSVLEASGKVVCVIQGHMHWHRYDVINGIPYIVCEDISEKRDPDEFPGGTSGKWALIEIDSETKSIRYRTEAKLGTDYVTIHDYIIPYKTTLDSDVTNFPEKVFALDNAATFSRASILSDASQLTINNFANILTSPSNLYLSEPRLSTRTIRIEGRTTTLGRAVWSFAPQTAFFRLRFSARVGSVHTALFKLYNTSNSTEIGPYFGFQPSGQFQIVNAANTFTNAFAYTANQWYEIDLIISTAARTYAIKVDGVTYATANAFWTGTLTTLKNLEIIVDTGLCFIDNLRIEKYSTTQPTLTFT